LQRVRALRCVVIFRYHDYIQHLIDIKFSPSQIFGGASSIVGTWNTSVDWGDTGSPIVPNPLTFNADGSWTYIFGGGRWIQMEGMYFFNFSNAAGLVYATNTTRDTVSGIMGYAVAGPNPGSGVWWARVRAPRISPPSMSPRCRRRRTISISAP
jgi:hypothetical protein